MIFNFTDEADLTGNIYNASGYQLGGTGVTVNLSNSVYTGAAAPTTAIHVNYTGSEYVRDEKNGYALETDGTDSALLENQNTSIAISEYYDLGHVANMIYSNGTNTVSMSLADGSIWYVTGTSIVSSLSVSEDSSIVLVGDATLTVDGVSYSSENCTDGAAYHIIRGE